MEYGGLFIAVAIILIIIVFIALSYASKMKRRSSKEKNNTLMLKNAVAMMFSHTVEVNLTRDTFVRKSANSGLQKPEKEHPGYDINCMVFDSNTIAEGADRDDYVATFCRAALMKAYTAGEKKIKRRYKMAVTVDGTAKYLYVESFFPDDPDGDVIAIILYREDDAAVVSKQKEMDTALEQKNAELKRLMNEKATLAVMLNDKTQAVDELTAKVGDMRTLIQESYSAIDKLVAEKNSSPLKPVPTDIRTSLKEIMPIVQELVNAVDLRFSLNVDNIRDTQVYMDSLHVNAVVLNMITEAFKCCEEGGKIIFTIEQTGEPVNGWAEYEYSCKYRGSSLSFNSELVNEIGGTAIIDRSVDGSNKLTVRVKYQII